MNVQRGRFMRLREGTGHVRPRASIAILALWSIALLSVFAIYISAGVRQRLDFLARVETRHDLRWFARAGIEQSLAELTALAAAEDESSRNRIWEGTLWEGYEFPVGRGFFALRVEYQPADFSLGESGDRSLRQRFGVEDEQSKLNINTAPPAVIARLFTVLGGKETPAAERVAAAIAQWRGDSQEVPGGEQGTTAGKGAWFESVEELQDVEGMSDQLWQQARRYLTVHGSGSVNLNTASRTVLAALGLGERLQGKILEFRCGPDGVPGTADDRLLASPFDSVAVLSQGQPLSAAEVAQISNAVAAGLVTTSSASISLRSVSRVSDRPARCEIYCVAETTGTQVRVRQWRMQYTVQEQP